MKQAYLICAHNNFGLLQMLIRQLDDVDTDIYIHIDKKAGIIDYSLFENIASLSKVYCLKDKERVCVIWGHVTQALTTIKLLELALAHGEYDYYHLVSGVDFPIKSNSYIKDFLIKHSGTEFVGFAPPTSLEYKLGLYHLIPNNLERRFALFKFLNKCIIKIQVILSIRHIRDTCCFSKGCNWWSITGKLAKAVVAHKDEIACLYRYTLCSDEIFLQTFISQHSDDFVIYDNKDEYRGCLRLIDWERGNPYVWKPEDIDELMASEALFARKFSEEYIDVIHKIVAYLKIQQ